jgi:hypothetical protein
MDGRTVGGTLGGRALAATAADAHAVDNVALLSLVTQTASLVRARRARSTVDDVELTELIEQFRSVQCP